MVNPIAPLRRRFATRLPAQAALSARTVARGLAAVAVWARLSDRPLRVDGADAAAALDRRSRALLWPVLTDTIVAIGALAEDDPAPAAGLAAIETLGRRLHERLASAAPPAAALAGLSDPPHIFVLEMLCADVAPCIGRWQPRLAAWRKDRRDLRDWPLAAACRTDLRRTRARLVERAWQLGIALDLTGLERVLPPRPAAAPGLAEPIAEIGATGATAIAPAIAAGGWQIYVEAASRLPPPEALPQPGALGEAIENLEALVDAVRTALKAMPAPPPDQGPTGVHRLALRLLSEGLLPFLAEWRPRYRRFRQRGRSETKWPRAEECRAALAATQARCLPLVEAIGKEIGVASLLDPLSPAAGDAAAPRRLPPPDPAPDA
jgi:hypothetical protein